MRVIATGRRSLSWPWVHWCLWASDCRVDGCPRDIYLHPFGVIIRLDDDAWR